MSQSEKKGTRESTKKAPEKVTARPGSRADKENGENAVLAKIAAMPEPYRAIGEQLHGIIKASAPALSSRVWYGMRGDAKDCKCACFFGAHKYMTFDFTEEANLFDEGARTQPRAFALKELTPVGETWICALVKKAMS